MAPMCRTCSTSWKSIVNFCPKCGTDLKSSAEEFSQVEPIKFNYEEQNSNFFRSPAAWVFMGLIFFAVIFAVIKSDNGSTELSTSQQNFSGNQNEVEAVTNEPEIEPSYVSDPMSSSAENQMSQPETADKVLSPSEPPKTFVNPKEKPSISLNLWVQKNGVINAIQSIYKWSSTYKTINSTQIESSREELEDALTALTDALDYIESRGFPKLDAYDKKQKELMEVTQEYIDTTSSLWIQINNSGSREETVELLEEKITSLGKVYVKAAFLIEWLKNNGSQYETR